jgi:hypothetical protein
LTLAVLPLTAQMEGDRGEASLKIGAGKVSVEYGRPALKGRDINSLISPGEEWRMGSNAATTLSSDVDLKFGSTVVQKGKYVLKAKLVEKGKWHLKIYKGDTVVAETPLTSQKASSSEEMVTIKLEKQGDGGKLSIQWGDFLASANFTKG